MPVLILISHIRDKFKRFYFLYFHLVTKDHHLKINTEELNTRTAAGKSKIALLAGNLSDMKMLRTVRTQCCRRCSYLNEDIAIRYRLECV